VPQTISPKAQLMLGRWASDVAGVAGGSFCRSGGFGNGLLHAQRGRGEQKQENGVTRH